MTASDPADAIVVLCWNLYHGRDRPPDGRLSTLRSKLFRRTEDSGTYLQVNRSLEREFVELIAAAQWSLCLLQEVPPAWAQSLAARTGADLRLVLTSRNQLAPLTRRLGRWNPDLVGSWEGGSNMTLVRPPWRVVPGSERSLLLNPLRARRLRERRRMGFARVRAEGTAERPSNRRAAELCVANLHASHYARSRAEQELRLAAEAAVQWAGEDPLVFGGDFNLRPRSSPIFEWLERDLGLTGVTTPDAIDHVLVRGLEIVRGPARWPTARRELDVPWKGSSRKLRLSDHAPVEVELRLPASMRY